MIDDSTCTHDKTWKELYLEKKLVEHNLVQKLTIPLPD